MAQKPVVIPRTFQLAGRTWKVKRNVRSAKWYGRTNSAKCLIELSTLNKSETEEAHTFLHELLHAVCYTMGYNKLNKDEHKIDGMASLLLQALTTGQQP